MSDINNPGFYPERCCLPCLFAAGGKPITIEIPEYSSGKCPVCGKRADLVSPKYFGYPVIKNTAYEEVE